MNTILQIPMEKDFRDELVQYAKNLGFPSIQSFAKVLFKDTIKRGLTPQFSEPITLSAKNAKRYDKMTEEILSGKVKLKTFDTVEEFMSDLDNENYKASKV